jgi:hypothetical protein
VGYSWEIGVKSRHRGSTTISFLYKNLPKEMLGIGGYRQQDHTMGIRNLIDLRVDLPYLGKFISLPKPFLPSLLTLANILTNQWARPKWNWKSSLKWVKAIGK